MPNPPLPPPPPPPPPPSPPYVGEEFLALSVEKVISLVQSDNLSVPSEEKVFESIIAWVNHDLIVRQDQVVKKN